MDIDNPTTKHTIAQNASMVVVGGAFVYAAYGLYKLAADAAKLGLETLDNWLDEDEKTA